jgi:hypothetical protein
MTLVAMARYAAYHFGAGYAVRHVMLAVALMPVLCPGGVPGDAVGGSGYRTVAFDGGTAWRAGVTGWAAGVARAEATDMEERQLSGRQIVMVVLVVVMLMGAGMAYVFTVGGGVEASRVDEG